MQSNCKWGRVMKTTKKDLLGACILGAILGAMIALSI
jgi:hypothetical protein